MSPLLWRSSRRHFLRHPWQLGLSVLGIALGVAVVVGVDLATSSARAAFRLSTEAVSGRATHQVVGGPGGVPDSVYRVLRVDLGIDAIAPVIEAYVRPAGADRRSFRLLGLDPFAEAPFRSYLDASDADVDLPALLATRGGVLLAADAARALGVAPGDTFRLVAGGVARAAVLAGVLAPADEASRRALADVMLADVAAAQELVGRTGVLDRIDVRAPADADSARALLDRLAAALPPGLQLVSVASRAEATGAMTRAFDLNLAALGLLALVFGVFLVYNSMTFSVVQRRGLIGLLRAQGVTRREVFVVLMGEALALGVVATILGCLLGVGLGAGLVRLVARTINDLYFALAVSGVTLTPWSLAKAVALGIGATAAASIPPAREATSTPPRGALLRSVRETRARASAGLLALAGCALIALGLLGLLLPSRGLRVSFAALFVVLIGGALLAPAATVLVSRAVGPFAARAFGLIGRMAARGVPATLSRTGPAIAALAVALAAGFAVATMIDSFRGTVAAWLDGTLRADVYVSAPGATANRSDTPLEAGLADRIRAVPGVAGVSTYRNVVVPAAGEDVRVVAVDLYGAHRAAFDLLEGESARVWPAFDSGTAVLVSESFAYRRGLSAGDTLGLPGAVGAASFRIAGVFRDYASEHGVVFMSRAAYDARWRDSAISSIAVFARPRTDPDTLLAALRALDTGGQEVFFRPDRALRDASLAVFDRTFAITGVLRLLALAVAFAGVLSALMALQLERAREIGVLRATGLTEGQVRGLVAAQTALMGLAAAVLALPLGALLSWIMVHVINRRSFGWTMRLDFDATRLGEVVVVALGAALLAGLYPAWRLSRTAPALALREE